ncbi:MAG: hypothetical protein NTU73_10740 [Ignavibacteriae bacterium]|nr:hypothetical protein [Ignavibacteriota bacterium]
MKKTLVLILLFVLLFGSTFAQDANNSINYQKSPELNFKYQKNLELKNKIVYGENRFSLKDTVNSIPQENRENPNKKSVFLGGLFSGIIPGAGQFYAKSYIKSASFLAAEVGLWVAYAIFQKKGNDQTDFFQNYANQNWDMRRYAIWLNTYFTAGVDITKSDQEVRAKINICEEKYFSHTLPPSGEQQYYEVIGKYKNFTAGWSSAPADITKGNWDTYPTIPQVDQYMSDRQQANTYYDRGSLMLTVVIINHLLSAADGVWSVMRYNSKFDVKTNINFQGEYSHKLQKSIIVPHFNVCITF